MQQDQGNFRSTPNSFQVFTGTAKSTISILLWPETRSKSGLLARRQAPFRR